MKTKLNNIAFLFGAGISREAGIEGTDEITNNIIEKRKIEKIVKTIHIGLSKSHKRKINQLHANKEKHITRTRLLKLLAENEITIMAIYLNKEKVYTKLRDEKDVLYNYVTNILLDRIYTKRLVPIDRELNLIASRKETNKFLNKNFQDYLSKQVLKRFDCKLNVTIKTPYEEESLQAVDFASWAIFRKYEFNDETYYNIIKKRIIEENALFR